MNLPRLITTAIIAFTTISTVICAAEHEGEDKMRAMAAFQDNFQEYLQSYSANLHRGLKEGVLVELHSVTFSGNGKNVAIGTWERRRGRTEGRQI